MVKQTVSKLKTEPSFRKIKHNLNRLFEVKNKKVRIIYRNNIDRFGNELPDNLISKTFDPEGYVLFIEFNNEQIEEDNIKKIIVLKEKETRELALSHPLSPSKQRFNKDKTKIDMKYIPKESIFQNLEELNKFISTL